jgi:hypothetical protein
LLFALSVSAEAQQTGKVARIGLLDDSTASNIAVRLEAFRQEMSKLGWIEGKNVAIEYRFAEGKLERLPELAVELVRLKVDLIVTSGTPGASAAKNATTNIPIVMTNAGDPVGAGLVSSLARPGGNVTGFSSLAPDRYQKVGDTQGRGPTARPSWTFNEHHSCGRQHSPPSERTQGRGYGTETKIGGDQDRSRRQWTRKRL